MIDPGGTATGGATYESAGVSIDAGDEAVRRIGPLVRSTYRPEVLGDVGGFGGLFAFDPSRFTEPVLVSTTDGVGTKAVVAQQAGRFDTIGIDLVAMCVDDLVCSGAEPLFFLDYLSIGRLDPAQVEALVSGIAVGCRQAGCALVGGEMAEHPGVMAPGDFDLAGFAVGVVERSRMIDGSKVSPGDVLLGLPSPGLRSNGYSLARRVFFEMAGLDVGSPAWAGPGAPTLGEELLTPSVIYAPAILRLIDEVEVHSVAHITGGGIAGNLGRVLSGSSDAVVDPTTWEAPRVFTELQRLGGVSDDEMARVFNLGVGMVVAVPAEAVTHALEVLSGTGHAARPVGEVVAGTGQVHLRPR